MLDTGEGGVKKENQSGSESDGGRSEEGIDGEEVGDVKPKGAISLTTEAICHVLCREVRL